MAFRCLLDRRVVVSHRLTTVLGGAPNKRRCGRGRCVCSLGCSDLLLQFVRTLPLVRPRSGSRIWRGYFTISSDNNFKACFVEANYSSGDRLQIWLTPDQDLFFSLRQNGIDDPNQKTARIWVDSAPASQAVIQYFEPVTIFSIGSLKKKVAELFEAIRMGNVLFVEIGGAIHKFSLRGTYGALSELAGCANLVRMGQPPPARLMTKDAQTSAARRESPPAAAPVTPSVTLSGTATAFVVAPTGHLLTNAHAVEDCKEVKVATDQGESVIARVVAIDKRNDLALLLVKDLAVPSVSFRKGLPRLGEAVYAYGFPLRSLLSSSGNFTSGMISALVGNERRFEPISNLSTRSTR